MISAASDVVGEGFVPRAAKAPDWTPEEDRALAEAYANGDRIDLVAEQLGRTPGAARSRADKIGLAGTHPIHGGWCTERVWTAEEDELLRQHYGRMKTPELARLLDRTKGGVFNRAFVLGLKHGYHREWSDAEIKAVEIAKRRNIGVADLADALGRKPFSVSKYLTNHGIHLGRGDRLVERITLEQLLQLDNPFMPSPATRSDDARERRAAVEAARANRDEQRKASRQERAQKRLETNSIRAARAAQREAAREVNARIRNETIAVKVEKAQRRKTALQEAAQKRLDTMKAAKATKISNSSRGDTPPRARGEGTGRTARITPPTPVRPVPSPLPAVQVPAPAISAPIAVIAPAPKVSPLGWIERQRAEFNDAVAWLRSRAILVDPIARGSELPRYKVSGRWQHYLPSDVIALAARLRKQEASRA